VWPLHTAQLTVERVPEGGVAFQLAVRRVLNTAQPAPEAEVALLDRVEEHRGVGSCNACAKAPELNLKFVVHHGEFIRRSGSHGEELTGQDVISSTALIA
jgi:hypothetical protein